MNHSSQLAAVIAHCTDDADFAEATIASFGYKVKRYRTPEEFAQEWKQNMLDSEATDYCPPSLAVLAGPIEEMASENAAATVREVSPAIPLVAAGTGSTVVSAVNLMRQGASDVVDLPCDKDQLGDRIRSSIKQAGVSSSCIARMAELRARLALLTPAEDEVLTAMLDGLANKQIAQRLGIGLRTVELRRSKIIRKMQAKSVAELVKLVCIAGGIESRMSHEQPASV